MYTISPQAKALMSELLFGDAPLAIRQAATRNMLLSWNLPPIDLATLKQECVDHGILSSSTIKIVFE